MESKNNNWSNICANDDYTHSQFNRYENEEDKAILIQSRRRKKVKNWLENKVNVSIDGEEYNCTKQVSQCLFLFNECLPMFNYHYTYILN